jgi:zinc transporter, ZIP family
MSFVWRYNIQSQIFLALLGSGVTAVATSIGAIPALAADHVSQKTQDTLMGFSAGVMLAASSFSLINPALKLASDDFTPLNAAILVGICILTGAGFLHLCNRYVPHEHFFTGREGGPTQIELKRIWLFVFAIALHNFPEGLAVGSGLGSQDLGVALPILTGIALQDMPEGFVVAMALISARYSRGRALWVAVITGIVEALAALLGYVATVEIRKALPWALSFAGGSMLYVVSNEMIPESHQKEYAQYATAGLMGGFVLMMILDTALG